MHLDNLTILFCLLSATTLLAFSFAAVAATNRVTRGAIHFSFAFAAGALSCCLFALVQARGPLSTFLNVVVGDTLVCIFLSTLHLGVRSHLRLTRHRWLFGTLPAIPFLLILFFTEIRDSITARILILGFYGFAIRLLIATDLIRSGKRKTQRALAYLMLLFAAVSLWQAVGTMVVGAPADYMRTDLIQSSVLFLYLLFVLAAGLILFVLLNDELVHKLADDADRDFLTGVLNRRGIERAIRAELERSERSGDTLVLGLLDVDHFKRINDTGGHAEGDRILSEITRLATASIRPYDYVGRFGGDEFLILLPGTGPTEGIAIAERVRTAVAHGLQPTSISVGLTTKRNGDDVDTLIRRADQALYRVKQSQRNSVGLD